MAEIRDGAKSAAAQAVERWSGGESPWRTVEELAERWRRSPQAIHDMRHRGNAPKGYRFGKRVLFKLEDIIEFEESRVAS